jgi:hypothetical protein
MCAGAKKEFGAGMGPRKMAFKKKKHGPVKI